MHVWTAISCTCFYIYINGFHAEQCPVGRLMSPHYFRRSYLSDDTCKLTVQVNLMKITCGKYLILIPQKEAINSFHRNWYIRAATSESVPLWAKRKFRSAAQIAFAQTDQIFTGRILHSQGCKVTSCEQRWFWTDCAVAQADFNLRWEHMSEDMFFLVGAYYVPSRKRTYIILTPLNPTFI